MYSVLGDAAKKVFHIGCANLHSLFLSVGKLPGCTTLSALGIARTFNFSGSDVCVMVSECDFNFCFFIPAKVVNLMFIDLFTLTRLKIFHPIKGYGSQFEWNNSITASCITIIKAESDRGGRNLVVFCYETFTVLFISL